MAQIKKLQKGNVFTIDGVAHNVDDKLIGRLYDHAKSLDAGDAAQFGKIIEALQNGENLSYDSVQNKLMGTVNWDLKNERQKRRVGKRNAFTSGLVADTQNAVGALRSFAPSAKYTGTSNDDDKKKEKIKKNWSDGYAVSYITDENGQKRLANTVNNQYAKNLLSKIHEITGYGDDIEFAGYNGNNKDYYVTWLSGRTGDSSTEALKQRLENGTLTAEDWAILGEVGITDGTVEDPTADQRARFKKAGIDWDTHKGHFVIDKDGNIDVTDAFRQATGHNGNFWFNNEWKTSDPRFDFLKGRMLWNGRLYNEADALQEGHVLRRQLSEDGGFFDLLRQGKRKEANDLMGFSSDLVARERYDKNGPYYSKWMQGQQSPEFWYSSLVGSHTTDGLQEGQQLIKYYDGQRDQWGRLTGEKYAILDANGDLVADNISADKISKIAGSNGADAVSLAKRISDSTTYKGYVQQDIGGGVGKGGFTLFSNPNTGELILDMGKHATGQFGKWVGQGAVRIPKAMADQINAMSPEKQKRMWDMLNKDEQLRKNFIRSLNQLGESKVGRAVRGTENWWDFLLHGNPILGFTDVLATDPMSKADWESLGFSKDLKEILANEATNGSRWARRERHFVEDYTPQIEMHQYGGTVGMSSIQQMPNTKITDMDKAANARELSEGNLNDADYWQIASIAGNIGALIANMTAAGAPVGAGIGVGATAAQLVSDIKRDGFQWGDIGSLALNLGLDAATLLPNAGVSSIAKLGRTVTKSAGLLKKVLMGVGAVRGVQGLTNIVNGNGTLDDWKALSQGLLVGQRAIKSGRNIAATKYKPQTAKAAPQTKEGIQKQYIEEFVANNKSTLPQTIKGISANGKVTNLAEAKAELKGVDGFSLPDKMATVQAAGSNVRGMFSSKWNPLSDQWVLRAENRALTPETLSAIKSGNSVWRSNAAHELSYLSPQVRAQIGAAGLKRPGDFNWGSEYTGNWFFRAPVFKERGGYKAPVTPATPALPAATPPLLLPAAPTTTVSASVAPPITVQTIPVQRPMLALPAAPTRTATPSLPEASKSLLLPAYSGRDAKGSLITPPPRILVGNGVQQTLFRKGGKVKKVCKAEEGTQFTPTNGAFASLNLGPKVSAATNPFLAKLQMNQRELEFDNYLKTSKENFFDNPLGYKKYKLTPTLSITPTTPSTVASQDDGSVVGKQITVTQGVDKKSPYNWKPAVFAATELGTAIGSAVIGGNKAKEAARKQALASKEFIPYEEGRIYSDQHIGRAESAAYKALNDQPMLTSNDPNLQRAYELEKAKQRVAIADNANAQRSAGITSWNQEEAARAQRNRLAGAQNQQSAVKAELLGDAQGDMIDATTQQSIANSIAGMTRELRTEDMYNTADANTLTSQQAAKYGQGIAERAAVAYQSEYSKDPDFSKVYGNDALAWLADKHPEEYASIMSSANQEAQSYYARNKKNTGILPASKSGSKMMRPTTDLLYIERQKHAHKSIEDLNNNLVKMFLKMMS